LAPSRAFVLFAGWEQSRLHGNDVTLEHLSDIAARLTINATYCKLSRQTGHLPRQVSEDDSRRIGSCRDSRNGAIPARAGPQGQGRPPGRGA